jgi:hypothetical protein
VVRNPCHAAGGRQAGSDDRLPAGLMCSRYQSSRIVLHEIAVVGHTDSGLVQPLCQAQPTDATADDDVEITRRHRSPTSDVQGLPESGLRGGAQTAARALRYQGRTRVPQLGLRMVCESGR